jgi:hypothetical protein
LAELVAVPPRSGRYRGGPRRRGAVKRPAQHGLLRFCAYFFSVAAAKGGNPHWGPKKKGVERCIKMELAARCATLPGNCKHRRAISQLAPTLSR